MILKSSNITEIDVKCADAALAKAKATKTEQTDNTVAMVAYGMRETQW